MAKVSRQITVSWDSTHTADLRGAMLQSAERGGRIDPALNDNQNAFRELNHLVRNMLRQKVQNYRQEQVATAVPEIDVNAQDV